MRRFWLYLRIYVRHLRRGVIPKRWPPRLIEPGRGKKSTAEQIHAIWCETVGCNCINEGGS